MKHPYYMMLDSDCIEVTPDVWQRRYPWKDPLKLWEHIQRIKKIVERNKNANNHCSKK